jgi:hypothetical protein
MANHKPTLTAGRFPRVVTVVKRGGPGSGFHGHRGRPGLLGGSLPSDMHFGVPQGKRIVKVLSVIDTREYEEMDDKWVPIAGSGMANVCERCGKLHEVHATVELEDGTEALMGTSCARAEFSEAARKQMGRKENAAKRLKAIETKADAIFSAQKAWDEEYGKVQGEGHPDPVITYKGDRLVATVGDDGKAFVFPLSAHQEEEKKHVVRMAVADYYYRRLRERGIGPRPIFDKYEHDKAVRKLKKTLAEADPEIIERGGPGSGHFGHEGIPEHQGGSLPGAGGTAAEKPAASKGEAEAPKAKGEAPTGEAPKGAPAAKGGMFPAGAEPAKGDDERTRADKLDIVRYAAWESLPKTLQDEVMRLGEKYEFDIPRDQSQAVAQFSVLHGALVKNLVSKGASEQDAASRATEILKTNMPELTAFATEAAKSWNEAEANIQTSHAKAKELGYENYYTNAYTGEPIPISNPEDEIFTGRDKARFNLQLLATMNANDITDPNDLTLGQMREAFRGDELEDRINSLFPANQAGKKVGEYYAETEGEEPAAEEPKKKTPKKTKETKPRQGIAEAVERGGPGSGHHGHAGRPGVVGGSLPGGEQAAPSRFLAQLTEDPGGLGWRVSFSKDGEKVGSGGYRDKQQAIAEAMEWEQTGAIKPKPGDFHSGQPKRAKRYPIGTLNGKKLSILHRPRTSAADTSESADYLIHGEQVYSLDTDRMMFKTLRDLLPVGYMTSRVTAKDWEPFIDEANRRGHYLPSDFHSAEMPTYSILREPDNYWGAPRAFRIGEKEYALDELGKMFADQPNMPEADRELAIRQVVKKPTKKAIGEILQWSSSRYNEMSKAKAVDYARKILAEGKEIAVLSAGSYTPSTAMTGSDYVVHGPQSYIAVGVGGTSQWRGEKAMEGFREHRRYYFDRPESVSKSFVARFTRRLKND